ncbi:alkylmercury lyase [Amycolatopsis sp. NBRC 101858]|uniref:organomercurial lyase n=1 Tax=Amycolatopsis sp. NBRC 101858 TaxID=3032200 RepID=UPI0024A37C72|nr:organomercurial lyase [Amycolatopsis sp. NBRC 101858]GLY42154.1 alkylmercury lyase [Amycolatopsis sp. NBRC 101858]
MTTSQTDRVAAARLAWAALKLTRAGRHPVGVERLAAIVGVAPAEVRRLVELIGFTLHRDLVSTGPAPRGAHHRLQPAEGTLGAGPDGTVDMFLLAIATGERVHAAATCPVTGTRIQIELTAHGIVQADPRTAVVAAVDLGFGLERADAMACAGQPFFASASAAAGWVVTHPGGRIYQVAAYLAQAHRLVAALEARPKYVL